jgi:predicted thioesterase
MMGQEIFFTVTLDRVEGNRLFFTLEARDGEGPVCVGRYERAAVSSAALMDRAQERCRRAAEK